MKLSVVASLYQSAAYVNEFYRRASDAASRFSGEDYEIVLVNDGSPDNSLELAVSLAEQDLHVVVVDLSRNFGHHKAMMTGLAHARGDVVFLLDSDLEEQPEWLLPFAEQMAQEKADVVFGVQEKRKGGLTEKLAGPLYYKLFRLLTGIRQPDNIVSARLMSRRYVDALLAHQEREINIGGLWMVTGFKQVTQTVVKQSSSPTTYTIRNKISHFVNAVTSFSSAPLLFTFYSGLMISLTALFFILHLIFKVYFIASPPHGYASIIASIWLFSGLIIFFLGIQGIYISKVFIEVKQRPYTIVRQVYRGQSS